MAKPLVLLRHYPVASGLRRFGFLGTNTGGEGPGLRGLSVDLILSACSPFEFASSCFIAFQGKRHVRERRGTSLIPNKAICCQGGPKNENGTDVGDDDVTACYRLFQGYTARLDCQRARNHVNRCVIDVRDKTSKYDTSPNCRALSDIAKRYIAAGGLKQSAPCTADRIAEGAHAKAWMALAVSKTGDPNLVIW